MAAVDKNDTRYRTLDTQRITVKCTHRQLFLLYHGLERWLGLEYYGIFFYGYSRALSNFSPHGTSKETSGKLCDDPSPQRYPAFFLLKCPLVDFNSKAVHVIAFVTQLLTQACIIGHQDNLIFQISRDGPMTKVWRADHCQARKRFVRSTIP